jgi:hypothetical protein
LSTLSSTPLFRTYSLFFFFCLSCFIYIFYLSLQSLLLHLPILPLVLFLPLLDWFIRVIGLFVSFSRSCLDSLT